MRLIANILVLFIAFIALTSVNGVENEVYDTAKVDELNDSSWECSAYDFEKSTKLANEALSISKKIGYAKGIATAFNRIAIAYDYKGVYDSALVFYLEALDKFKEIKDTVNIALTYNNIGASNYVQAKYADALEAYLQSLILREKINDLKGIAQSHNNIGLIYRVQKKYEKAIESYRKSINIRKRIREEQGLMWAEQNIGVTFEKISELDSALVHYSNALSLAEKLNDSLTMASNLVNKSMVYKLLGEFEIAIQHAKKAEDILRKQNVLHTLAYSLASIGDLYFEMENYNKTFDYVFESLELAKTLGRKELEQSCYQILSNTYTKTGDYKQALEYHQLYASIKDSILSEKSANQLNELQTKYETIKKEQKIASLTQEKLVESQRKSIFLGIAILLLLSVIIIILLLRQNKLKAKEQAIILKQKMLRSQMNPHFIFNALSSIQSFIFYNKSDEAINYLSKFSTLMRDILEASVHDFISIKQDMAIADNYLLLQQLRHEEKFNYKIEVKGDISNLQIPPMLTQPFIENAVKHGVGEMDSDGKINVCYYIGDKDIIIEISDNGAGIKETNKSDKNHKSYAISLTKQRLALVGKDCNVVLTSPINEDGGGTKVTLTIIKQACLNDYYE